MQTTGFKSATLTHSSCIKFTIISINTCSVTFRFFMSREVSKLTEREFAMKQEKVGHARVRARQQQLPPTHPRAIMLANVRLPHMWTNWVHVWKWGVSLGKLPPLGKKWGDNGLKNTSNDEEC